MITLTLLHPVKSVPVQKWNFESSSVIKVGRANDNNVILYSAVVSRHHLELRQMGNDWVLISLGSNGTFINGKRVNKVLVRDGTIVRLASSGPQIRIRLDSQTVEEDRDQRRVTKPEINPVINEAISKETILN